MISYIKGELCKVGEDYIILETGAIGYEIRVPISVIQELSEVGSVLKVYTYLYVREDAMLLYGFLSQEDVDIFKLLITVNGIGPRGALRILSVITPDELRFAILSDDVKTISKAPGIGTKTAGKLILELKDKLKLEDAFNKKIDRIELSIEKGNEKKASFSVITKEAIQALVALGYSNTEAFRAVKEVEIKEGITVEEVLKQSLKKISLL